MKVTKSSPKFTRPILIACFAMLFVGCSSLVYQNFDTFYGIPVPKEYTERSTTPSPSFYGDVQPILETRCVVCHGCYDAPCQLKLESYEGILRGASPQKVYNGARLSSVYPTRLFIDAQSTAAWRARDFHPVINERTNSANTNIKAGLIGQMLELKQQNPLPKADQLPDTFDFSINRDQQCSDIENFADFAEDYPLWGMPFALPGLSQSEHRTLINWLANGAEAEAREQLPQHIDSQVKQWEEIFNGGSLKHQLAARYLYEHLFIANLYFEDKGQDTVYFKLVRSYTPPGEPISIISTVRPYDHPRTDDFYYRLWREPSSITAKTHMPYPLDNKKLKNWKRWFFDSDYTVEKLPSYGAAASNPFATFKAIPMEYRHRFLLDEAQFTIMNFIKGPVCRGNAALNVIQDHFWVFFIAPLEEASSAQNDFLAEQADHLRLPAESESGVWSITHWRRYAKAQENYIKAKGEFLRENHDIISKEQINLVWDGYKTNDNASLTVFRHHDSATVVKGLVGQPDTIPWVIDYSVLERIHYLLVAGFDVFGTASHQAMTRLYMDFLRMESELNFTGFLPANQRSNVMAPWYIDAEDDVSKYLTDYYNNNQARAPYEYKTDNPKAELLALLTHQVKDVLKNPYAVKESRLPDSTIRELDKLNIAPVKGAQYFSDTSFINIKDHGVLTLLANRRYTNISSIFGSADRRVPAKDTILLANGIIGAYPNTIFQLSTAQIPEFVEMVQGVTSEESYRHLLDRFGVRRTDSRFWAISDEIHEKYRVMEPLRAGILDYNRLENR
ncbi:fatty acid cis/trans isomerase [Aurantivibrio plasticivorans]